MDEKFENQIAVVRECFFEAADVGEPGFHSVRGEFVRKRADRDLLIPGAVHDREFARLRNGVPVAAEVRIALFELGRRLGVHDGEPARIEILDELPDHLPLAGGGPALKNQNDREICGAERCIQRGESRFQGGHHSLIILFRKFLFQIHLFEHCKFLLYYRQCSTDSGAVHRLARFS